MAAALGVTREPDNSDQLESNIKAFGRKIFAQIGRSQPSAFNTSYWTGKIMEWSMQFQKFKTDMFRLVDVLPALSSSRSIAAHVSEYLSDSASEIATACRLPAPRLSR